MSDPTPPQERPRGSAATLALIPVVALALYGADQLSKVWVLGHLVEGTSTPVIDGVLYWTFVRNPGAAFSMASGSTWIFTAIALLVVVAIVVLAKRIRSRAWAIVFGLVLGGVLGNLTDRLIREPGFGVGHVIDFIHTPWMMPAIYNVADCGIVVGMCSVVILSLLDVGLDGQRGRSKKQRDAADAARTAGHPDAARDASPSVLNEKDS